MAAETDRPCDCMVHVSDEAMRRPMWNKLSQMRENNILCDVQLALKSEQDLLMPVHSCVLVATSDYFQPLAKKDPLTVVIFEIPVIRLDVMDIILQFIYTGKLKAKIAKLRDVMQAADILEMEELEELSRSLLEQHQVETQHECCNNIDEQPLINAGPDLAEVKWSKIVQLLFEKKQQLLSVSNELYKEINDTFTKRGNVGKGSNKKSRVAAGKFFSNLPYKKSSQGVTKQSEPTRQNVSAKQSITTRSGKSLIQPVIRPVTRASTSNNAKNKLSRTAISAELSRLSDEEAGMETDDEEPNPDEQEDARMESDDAEVTQPDLDVQDETSQSFQEDVPAALQAGVDGNSFVFVDAVILDDPEGIKEETVSGEEEDQVQEEVDQEEVDQEEEDQLEEEEDQVEEEEDQLEEEEDQVQEVEEKEQHKAEKRGGKKMTKEDKTAKSRYTCSACNEVFSNQSTFQKHLSVAHPNEKLFDCHLCGLKLKNEWTLRVHLKRHQKPTVLCWVCGNAYKTVADMHSHMKIHIGIKKYTCEKCGKKFMQRSNWRLHMKRCGVPIEQRDQSKAVCPYCAKVFANKESARRHFNRNRCKMYPYYKKNEETLRQHQEQESSYLVYEAEENSNDVTVAVI